MAQKADNSTNKRWVRWVLGASLALNLLFIGAIAGAALRHGGGSERRAGPDAHGYGVPYVRALPRDARKSMRRAMRQSQDGAPTRAERRMVYAQMLTALRAEPFDQQEVLALFETQRGHALNVQATAQTAWLGEVASMSASERMEFANRLEALLSRGPRNKNERQWK